MIFCLLEKKQKVEKEVSMQNILDRLNNLEEMKGTLDKVLKILEEKKDEVKVENVESNLI